MKEIKWLGLQLFADGGDGGAGEGTGTAGEGEGGAQSVQGEAAPHTNEQRLKELGVPEAILNRRKAKGRAKEETQASTGAGALFTENPEGQTATATEQKEQPKEEQTQEAPKKATWDEIMADPDYNKAMQDTVQKRVKKYKEGESKLAPMLEILARNYGIEYDPENPDVDAIVQAVSNDDQYYENKAMELGVSVEAAKRMDQLERDSARRERETQASIQEQAIQQHIAGLIQQGIEFAQKVPGFDIRQELQSNKEFARLTSPAVGLSVEQAFNALHHDEIMRAQQAQKMQAVQMAQQQAVQKTASTIAAGQMRPNEGFTSQGASDFTFSYRNASPEQRAQLKAEIKKAAAEGKKIYPIR